MRHRFSNQSSTDGLSLIVRYSVVPIRGVGSAVIGVRMMSHDSKNAPKAREVVLNTACICARSVKVVCMPVFPDADVDRLDQIRPAGCAGPWRASRLAMVCAKLLM